jgi:Tat protein translocase TatB subunit
MFGIGMPELLVIAVVALLVVGPKRLPDIAKALGKGLSEFRKAADGATETIKETLKTDELKRDMEEMKESFLHGNGEDQKKSDAQPAPGKDNLDASSDAPKPNPPHD